MPSSRLARIYVIAGVNGAGKSSIGGAAFRSLGGEYFNPDEAARELMTASPGLDQATANGAAWRRGSDLLRQAIAQRLDYAFESTLSGSTIPRLTRRPRHSRGIDPPPLRALSPEPDCPDARADGTTHLRQSC